MAMAIGLSLVLASVALLLHQARTLRSAAVMLRQQQDMQAVLQLTRGELRRAGLRQVAGPSTEHDRILVEGSPGALQIQYRIDAGSPAPSASPTSSTLRLSAGVLQFRSPVTGGFQSLHDASSLHISALQARSSLSPACFEVITLGLERRAQPGASTPQPLQATVRRRNHGLTPCEPA